MNSQTSKNPSFIITFFFFILALVSFIILVSPSTGVISENGWTNLGHILILTCNIGFWGLAFRASRHFRFYLGDRPGAGFMRILFTLSFVIVFIFSVSYFTSRVKNLTLPQSQENGATEASDAYSVIKKEIEKQKSEGK